MAGHGIRKLIKKLKFEEKEILVGRPSKVLEGAKESFDKGVAKPVKTSIIAMGLHLLGAENKQYQT